MEFQQIHWSFFSLLEEKQDGIPADQLELLSTQNTDPAEEDTVAADQNVLPADQLEVPPNVKRAPADEDGAPIKPDGPPADQLEFHLAATSTPVVEGERG